MDILINGQKADITLDNEQTVGDILAAFEQWLGNSTRLSGLSIDGEMAHTGSLEELLRRDIQSVKTLDIITSSLPQLIIESLLRVYQDIDEYENLGFDEKQRFREQWGESPQARLLAEQLPELSECCITAFSGNGLNPRMLRAIIEERLREFQDPAGELGRVEPLVAEICVRLEDLPLDIQTGKDSRAVETVRIFSNIAEKIFRIFNVLKAEGLSTDEIKVAEIPVSDYIAEFSAALKELLAAYEQRDAVLVGDLAEYELAPRLRGLYAAMRNPAESPA
jgi:hypothetical protein